MLSGRAILLLTSLTLLVSACAEAGSNPTSAERHSDPPWGLEVIDLPDDPATVAGVFAGMPASIDGVSRVETMDEAVVYEQGQRFLSIRAIRASEIPAGPEGGYLTSLGFIEMILGGEIESVEASQVDPDLPLGYVIGTSSGDDQTMFSAFWANPASDWVFTAVGDTSAARTEVVHAFMDACEQSS